MSGVQTRIAAALRDATDGGFQPGAPRDLKSRWFEYAADRVVEHLDLDAGPVETVNGRMRVRDVLRAYAPGNMDTWTEEFAWLAVHGNQWGLRVLRNDVIANGVREPILLGDDGRVWDGHHRLLLAIDLNLDTVPVEHGHTVTCGPAT